MATKKCPKDFNQRDELIVGLATSEETGKNPDLNLTSQTGPVISPFFLH
jgi:hypothetical protein